MDGCGRHQAVVPDGAEFAFAVPLRTVIALASNITLAPEIQRKGRARASPGVKNWRTGYHELFG
ncbi:MAG: hypothetical protein HC900_08985 [Methylacidiphilales bacterium]|nr:hypothetical protein [Candidatus Methylacidiphilales bacterium]